MDIVSDISSRFGVSGGVSVPEASWSSGVSDPDATAEGSTPSSASKDVATIEGANRFNGPLSRTVL